MAAEQAVPHPAASVKKPGKKTNWLKISHFANVAIVALAAIGLGSLAVLHQSDTNPCFYGAQIDYCAQCHLMRRCGSTAARWE
jgi:hypothetical protein